MTDNDKKKCAEEMYEFWRKSENVVYLLNGDFNGFSPVEIRLFFCDVLTVYLNFLMYKEEMKNNEKKG